MNARLLSFAGATVLILAAAPTLAQQFPTVTPPGASTTVLAGRWLHDDQNKIIGNIKSVSPDGRVATIMLGTYLLDNVRVMEVPVSALSVLDGKVALRRDTAEALNAPTSR